MPTAVRVIVVFCWLAVAAYAPLRAGMVEPIVTDARGAVTRQLGDAGPQFVGVHTRTVEYEGKSTRVVCGFVRETDAAASMPWVFLETTGQAYVLSSRKERRATELISKFCP